MKFDFVIGNPPYQDTQENVEWDLPIYHTFMEAAFEIADKVEFITPGRFLFNAGKTPKGWNQKMLEDEHFKVLDYSVNSSSYFSGVDIKGGVAITYRDTKKNYGSIGTFTIYEELNTILKKVRAISDKYLDTIMFSAESYRFTDKMLNDYPQVEGMLSKGHKYDIASNTFKKLLGMVFFEKIPKGEKKDEYMQIYGRVDGVRQYLWIKKEYVFNDRNIDKYKVFIPAANGSGALGEVLSTPVIGEPVIGHNQTFISLGSFDTRYEAESALSYVKTKFARALIGTLKVTQNGKKGVYKNVPIQDFTKNSDINWEKSISDIDNQLYDKYCLSDEEIQFINNMIKPME